MYNGTPAEYRRPAAGGAWLISEYLRAKMKDSDFLHAAVKPGHGPLGGVPADRALCAGGYRPPLPQHLYAGHDLPCKKQLPQFFQSHL